MPEVAQISRGLPETFFLCVCFLHTVGITEVRALCKLQNAMDILNICASRGLWVSPHKSTNLLPGLSSYRKKSRLIERSNRSFIAIEAGGHCLVSEQTAQLIDCRIRQCFLLGCLQTRD